MRIVSKRLIIDKNRGTTLTKLSSTISIILIIAAYMDAAASKRRTVKFPWSFAVLFLLPVLALLVVGYTSYDTQKASLEISNQDRLNMIADMKEQQINAWVDERWENVYRLESDPVPAPVQSVLKGSGDQSSKTAALTWLTEAMKTEDTIGAVLLDAQGAVLLSVPDQPGQLGENTADLARKAVAERSPVTSDLYRDPTSGRVYVDFLIPFWKEETAWKNGFLLVRIDPETVLFPLIQTWPVSSQSAEALLVRLEGSNVRYLSPSDQGGIAALGLNLLLDTPQLLEAKAAQTETSEMAAGLDYQGTPVFGVSRIIHGTSWTLIVKINQDEIYAPLRDRQLILYAVTSAVLIATITLAGMLWRQREARFYKEQYLAEVSRQALSEHLLYLSRYANDIILLADRSWLILEANDRALDAYHYTQAELSNMTVPQLCVARSRSEFFQQVAKLEDLDGLRFEIDQNRKDGTSFPVEISVRNIQVDQKYFYQIIIRDITERKRAEERLRESEKRFRLFYEQAPVGYQTLDEMGRVTDINTFWSEYFGYEEADVLGKSFASFLDEASREQFTQAYPGFIACGEIRIPRYEFICGDGSSMFVSLTGKASFDEMGIFKEFQCILHDMTQQHQVEEQVRRMNEELERHVMERTSQLEAANKELEAFSYSVSHDLRAPLRAIDGFSRILAEECGEELSEGSRRYLDLVRENTHTMSNLIDNLLAFSRLSRQPLKKQHVNPTQTIEESLQLLSAQRDGRSIQFVVHPLPDCEADPVLLKQVYINLLSNAIKFTGKKMSAVIEVGCLDSSGEKIFYVKDNGVGFDMQYAPKLFGVFQRLHRVEDYEGTGVGLAIVQRIVSRHGGRVWAEGEVNQGATFCFTLQGQN